MPSMTGELTWNCHLSGLNVVLSIQVLQGELAELKACNKTMLLLAIGGKGAVLAISHELVRAGCANLPALIPPKGGHLLQMVLTSQQAPSSTVLIDNVVD